jgi:hypothetical protein
MVAFNLELIKKIYINFEEVKMYLSEPTTPNSNTFDTDRYQRPLGL